MNKFSYAMHENSLKLSLSLSHIIVNISVILLKCCPFQIEKEEYLLKATNSAIHTFLYLNFSTV